MKVSTASSTIKCWKTMSDFRELERVPREEQDAPDRGNGFSFVAILLHPDNSTAWRAGSFLLQGHRIVNGRGSQDLKRIMVSEQILVTFFIREAEIRSRQDGVI